MRLIGSLSAGLLWLALLPAGASASFPGLNGLLAVERANGPGIALVRPGGSVVRTICGSHSACAPGGLPRWASDGGSLIVSPDNGGGVPPGVTIIYGDGSCLDCEPIAGGDAAPMADPSVISVVSGDQLLKEGVDGTTNGVLLTGFSDAVWSAAGTVAVVRRGQVWTGDLGHLRRLGVGSVPSWSPNGSRIAIVRGEWIVVAELRSGTTRRLVRGRAPAWSPDGRLLAYLDGQSRVRVIRISGGRARAIGGVRGTAVDWQPLPSKPVRGCHAPPGSRVMAASATSVVTSDGGAAVPPRLFGAPAYMGCLVSTGQERLLARFDTQGYDAELGATDAAAAGNYAALATSVTDLHYGGNSETVGVYDLRSGQPVSALGGEQVSCGDYSYDCLSSLDGLVIDDQGFTAAHAEVRTPGQSGCSDTTFQPCPGEEIIASDSAGVHVVDGATNPGGSALLTDLTLSGEILTWQHAEAPESTQLH
jgi:hypothetical protein